MQAYNNDIMDVQEIELCKGTILEQFLDYTRRHRKVSDIITFLSVKYAELIGLSGMGKIDSNLAEELFKHRRPV